MLVATKEGFAKSKKEGMSGRSRQSAEGMKGRGGERVLDLIVQLASVDGLELSPGRMERDGAAYYQIIFVISSSVALSVKVQC